MKSSPAAVSWGPGRVDLFAKYNTSSETTLFHRAYEAGWQASWQDLLTARTSIDWVGDPRAASMAMGRVDVFAQSSDNLVWHMWYDAP